MNNEIQDAYSHISLDKNRKNEILNTILSECREHQQEDYSMRKNHNIYQRKVAAVAVIIATLCCTGIGTYAATHFMSASNVAKMFSNNKLADELSRNKLSESAEQITEQNGYRFAYLGSVSGTNLEELLDGESTDSTYIVVAAERLDGKPIESESFVASPLIEGLNPAEYNIYSMGGGATYKVIDGVYYMIVNCSNIEMFADRSLYVAITNGADYQKGYNFNTNTGLITRNEDFIGLNVLFQLELDASKADKTAQEKYLSDFGNNEDEEMTSFSGSTGSAPMLEDCIECDNELAYFAMNIDYQKLAKKDMDYIVSLGKIIDELSVKEKNGVFEYYTDNEYISGGGFSAAECYVDGNIYFSPSGSGDESDMIFEYECVNDHVLDYKVIHYDEAGLQAIYDYFH